jgi:hypothetical protein
VPQLWIGGIAHFYNSVPSLGCRCLRPRVNIETVVIAATARPEVRLDMNDGTGSIREGRAVLDPNKRHQFAT